MTINIVPRNQMEEKRNRDEQGALQRIFFVCPFHLRPDFSLRAAVQIESG